jgi:hypothetical protein
VISEPWRMKNVSIERFLHFKLGIYLRFDLVTGINNNKFIVFSDVFQYNGTEQKI